MNNYTINLMSTLHELEETTYADPEAVKATAKATADKPPPPKYKRSKYRTSRKSRVMSKITGEKSAEGKYVNPLKKVGRVAGASVGAVAGAVGLYKGVKHLMKKRKEKRAAAECVFCTNSFDLNEAYITQDIAGDHYVECPHCQYKIEVFESRKAPQHQLNEEEVEMRESDKFELMSALHDVQIDPLREKKMGRIRRSLRGHPILTSSGIGALTGLGVGLAKLKLSKRGK